MTTSERPFDSANADAAIQAHYRKMIADGQSPRFAEMCALMQAPGTKGSDRAFMEGRLDGNWMDGLPRRQANWMVKEARAAGINPTGKFYLSGIADKRGHMDPRAWVDSIDDVRRVAKDRNLNVQGMVNIEASPEPKRQVALNPKLARELARKEIANDPGLPMKDALAKVREKHTPRWKKK
jgi:hypothetical protein